MGRGLWRVWVVIAALWLWMAFSVLAQGESFAVTGTINVHNTSDFRDLHFIELRFADSTSVVVSGDRDVPFVRQLAKRDGQKIRFELSSIQLEKVER